MVRNRFAILLFFSLFMLGADAAYNPGRFPIEVEDLADNTDGELPTWDSNGVATTFGPGTANQYIASQGAGAEPIFKSILDEDNMVSDSATDVASQQSIKKYVDDNATTKEIFVLPTISGLSQASVGNWRAFVVPSTSFITFVWQIPNDFTTLSACAVLTLPDATETLQWDTDISTAAGGIIHSNDDRSVANDTLAVTVNLLTELDISDEMTSLVAGEYIAVQFSSDTDNIRVLGLRFKYN